MKGRKISEYPMTVYVWFLQKFSTDIWNAIWCNWDWRCAFLGQVGNLVSFRVLAKVHPESLKNWNRSSWRALLPEPVHGHRNAPKEKDQKPWFNQDRYPKQHDHHQSKTFKNHKLLDPFWSRIIISPLALAQRSWESPCGIQKVGASVWDFRMSRECVLENAHPF